MVRWRALVVALVAVLGSAVGVAAEPTPAAAYPTADVALVGHGYGHGRGMGQWGAFGYAYAGSSWQQIVTHYYQGAQPAYTTPAQEGRGVRVVLTENDGNSVIVTSQSGFTVDGTAFAPGSAVLMIPGAGSWNVYSGPGCAGPWSLIAPGVVDPTAAPDQNSTIGAGNSAQLALQLCQGGGNLSVRGSLIGTFNGSGQARTVNYLPLEEYVAGVMPNESPAYWGTLGPVGLQGRNSGYQELEAQAVAVRSYVMASPGGYGGYADTCDLACQTYRGLANESPLTDQATLDTLGYVMEAPGTSAPLTTEYSSSTGGYTAPGTFPAVADDGDAVCPPGVNGACNPNHTWKVSVPVSTIEAAWPSIGTLETFTVTGRNGYGEWGGRVTALTLTGTTGTVVVSGDQFAAACNLLSNWFTVSNALPSPAVALAATPTGHGYWIAGTDGTVASFGDATPYGSAAGLPLAAPVVGVSATTDGRGYWLVASDGGIFSYGDAAFFGSTGAIHLNQPIVGLARTPDGQGYWLVASDGGIFAFGDARFFGSTGSIRLNQPVVGMTPTPDGQGYWLVASDGGIFAFGDAGFAGSMGAHPLNRPIVGMAGAAGGTGYWLVASDGGIFAFGSAAFLGSAGATPLVQPVVGMARTPSGQGYWMVAADGGIFTYGDAGFYGSAAG